MKNKEIIERKVEDFAKNEKTYLSKTFQETEARNRFIDPFFQALGWEFDQTSIQRKQWDVHREFSQKDNSTTKKPDYAFRIDGKLKFFVEAKAPWVRLIDNPDKDAIFQAKRYAYSTNGKAPIIILTDFHEFRVFNALQKPVYENLNQGVLKEFDFHYPDYINKWDFIYENFSKEAVLAGSLEKLRGKISKSTKTLDAEFLEEIIKWREHLAKNIAVRNESLTVDEINEAVQRILDRLIFIRNLEDREIIGENTLLDITKKKENLYHELLPLFFNLNVNYNGLLFKPHFSEKLTLDDKVLNETIQDMCYPKSPFQFDVIEPEILGRIYEKFLGSKIRLTDSHRAKVEEKEEVRHAGGVYYTPQFIVDYIVKETVGKKLTQSDTGRTSTHSTGSVQAPLSDRLWGISPEEVAKIKILDPACGSGSFLLGAYHYLLEYHRKFYSDIVGAGHAKSLRKYKDDFFINPEGEVKLTIKKKGEILVNNIYGVDIDREATEVAILSLYLKLLEHGIEDDQGWLFMKGKVLPDMTGNIKCGNSLVNREDLFSNNMFGASATLSNRTPVKAFDWETEFPGVFNPPFPPLKKGGAQTSVGDSGFDCVIGNPPYIRIQEMQKWAKDEVELYKKIFKSGSKGNFDIYVLFIEKALSLLNANGLTGFILPHKFFNATYGEQLRDVLSSGKNVAEIVHFGDLQIFDGPTTYTCLLFLSKSPIDEVMISKVKSIEGWREENKAETGKIAATSLTSGEWNLSIGKNAELLKNVSHITTHLEDVTERIYQGLKTSADKIYILEEKGRKGNFIYVFSRHTEKEYKVEAGMLYPLMKGGDSKRYSLNRNTGLLILFPYKKNSVGKMILMSENEIKEHYSETYSYLKECKSYLENREDGKMKGKEWYAFGRSQALDIIHLPKIFTPDIAPVASYSLDETGDILFTGGAAGGYGIIPNNGISFEYLLGLLNSKLLDTINKQTATQMRGGWYSFESRFIKSLPIYIPDPKDNEKFPLTQKIEEFVKQILEFRKKGKTGDAEFLEKKIDEMVEVLYGVRGI